jgi:hypothetical protein
MRAPRIRISDFVFFAAPSVHLRGIFADVDAIARRKVL